MHQREFVKMVMANGVVASLTMTNLQAELHEI